MRTIAVLTLLLLSALPPPAASQTANSGEKPKPAAPRPYTPPRTPDGQPDIQGVWTNATITPFERPAAQGGKAFLTEEEAAAVEKRTLTQRAQADNARVAGNVGSYNDFWMDSGTRVVTTRQTSLVVEPEDGRVPLTRAAEKARDDTDARSTDSPELMSVWDRCITR